MIPKIYECLSKDQLRPIMNYAFITKKKTVATDGHVLLVHDTEKIFDRDFVDALPKDGILVGETALRDMAKKTAEFIHIQDGKIRVMHKSREGYTPVYWDYGTQEKLGTFPKWETVMPEKNGEDPPAAIGINAKLMLKLQTAFGHHCNGLKCYFNGAEKAIICEPMNAEYNSPIGIVMPMMITS
jgi:hypothetical protein